MRSPSIQYTPVVGPLTTATPQETTFSAFRQQPDPPRRAGIVTALTVAACVWVPTFAQGSAAAPTDWRPTHPSAVAAKARATDLSQFVIPLTIPDVTDPTPVLAWGPDYPDFARGRGFLAATQLTWASHVEPVAIVQPDPGGASIATGAVPILQYQAFAGPIFTTIPFLGPDNSWAPKFPDRNPPPARLHAALQPSWFFDRFAAPDAVTVVALSWTPEYPDAVAPKKGLQPRQQQSFVADTILIPGAAPSPELAWSPRYVDRHSYARPLAPYVWAHEHFSNIVQVPVMSWTGWYLENPVRGKGRQQLQTVLYAPLEQSLVATPAPTWSWAPTYADFARARARKVAALESKAVAPIFVADTTIQAPALSWAAKYADRVPAARRVLAGAQPAFAFDARFLSPDEVIAPDLAAPVYPDRVPGRKPLVVEVRWAAPYYIVNVTTPAPVGSWQSSYPALVWGRVFSTANQDALFFPEFIPDVTHAVTPLQWAPEFPDFAKGLEPRPHLVGWVILNREILVPTAVFGRLTRELFPNTSVSVSLSRDTQPSTALTDRLHDDSIPPSDIEEE